MKSTSIRIATDGGGKRRIRAFRIGSFAVHASQNYAVEGYVVSHLPTGLAVPAHIVGSGLTEAEALSIARHLNSRFGAMRVVGAETYRPEDFYVFQALAAEALDPEMSP